MADLYEIPNTGYTFNTLMPSANSYVAPKGSSFSGANSMASFIVPAAASVVGAGISSVGGKQAAKSQERTAANALDFAKSQEAQRKAAYDQAMSQYQAQWQAQQARKDALLKYYGFDVSGLPSGMASTPAGGTPGAPSLIPQAVPRMSTGQGAPIPTSIAALMQPQPGIYQAAASQAPEAQDQGTGGVFDWKRLGLMR